MAKYFTPPNQMSAKSHIFSIKRILDSKEKMNYEPNNYAYLTEPEDVGFDVGGSSYMLDDEPGLETMVRSLPASGNFKPTAILVMPLVSWSLI
ncbi:uncharacterized protein A4U43_C07F27170 [Asparagus officinalis]|uniref:Uncharacterized protein n=1 Tax=Asparagus officinalis TaxID=4686 RepID=A0A5P1EIV5_ASPOF|nr:uncharacterized protein A4U43_C07F27170 [Asparagus officinalis]